MEVEDCLACSGKGKLASHFSQGKAVHSCPWCGEVGMVYAEVNRSFARVKKVHGRPKMCHVFGIGCDHCGRSFADVCIDGLRVLLQRQAAGYAFARCRRSK